MFQMTEVGEHLLWMGGQLEVYFVLVGVEWVSGGGHSFLYSPSEIRDMFYYKLILLNISVAW